MSLELMESQDALHVDRSMFDDNGPRILTDIYQSEQNIAIWRRTLPTALTQDINHLLEERSNLALVQSITPSNATDWIQNKLDGHACAEALAEDIALVVDMYCCLFDVKEAGLRLTVLQIPMCPKFHVDHVPCRLVTTYKGTATQWLENADIDRTKLGAGSLGQPDHSSGLFANQNSIQQMHAGDVALLKGSGWEGNENGGLVHRSPSGGPNERRLLLTLDFV